MIKKIQEGNKRWAIKEITRGPNQGKIEIRDTVRGHTSFPKRALYTVSDAKKYKFITEDSTPTVSPRKKQQPQNYMQQMFGKYW